MLGKAKVRAIIILKDGIQHFRCLEPHSTVPTGVHPDSAFTCLKRGSSVALWATQWLLHGIAFLLNSGPTASLSVLLLF